MNSVILSGNVVRDCETRYSVGEKQTAISKFCIAVRREFEDGIDFINCKSFGKIAEAHERLLKKGNKVIVQGRMRSDSYTNKQGAKVYYTELIVDKWEFAEKKATSNAATDTDNQASSSSSVGDGFMNIPDGIDPELPFN